MNKFKIILISVLLFSLAIALDRYSKSLFIDGYRYHGSFFSLIYVLNRGVAFSLFSSFSEYLKWIQLVFIFIIFLYIYILNRDYTYYIPIALILGSAISNVIDRFLYGGVVDFFYWHYLFNFAIFNLADVFINIGVVYSLLIIYLNKTKKL